jgi:hypothetical protein
MFFLRVPFFPFGLVLLLEQSNFVFHVSSLSKISEMLSIVWTVSVGFLGKNFSSKGAGKTGRLSARPFVGVCQVSLFAFICLHKDWERRVSAVSKEFFGVTFRSHPSEPWLTSVLQ